MNVKTKTKYQSVATLKRKLWKEFSLYIRRREADADGCTRCFTCGVRKHYTELDAGHYIPKSVGGANLYFSEHNVHAQCTACNRFRHGNLHVYALRLQEKYGDGILQRLEAYRKGAVKYNSAELTLLIKHYRKLNGYFTANLIGSHQKRAA